MRKGRRKSNVNNKNEEVKGKCSEEEEIKYLSVAETFTVKLYIRKQGKAVVKRKRFECISVVK